MSHGQKTRFVVAIVALASAAGLAYSQATAEPLAEQYPELFGRQAKATIVSFSAVW